MTFLPSFHVSFFKAFARDVSFSSLKLLQFLDPFSVYGLLTTANAALYFYIFWKCSKVTALFILGDRTKASNYRPISTFPTLSKILERAVQSQFYEYLQTSLILTDKQFGFRPKNSTISALTSFGDEILRNMEHGKLSSCIFRPN